MCVTNVYHIFDVFCDLLLNRPTATWSLFALYNLQKRKKTDTHTCLEPLDCSRICGSWGIFKSQTLLFVSASSFFSLTFSYPVYHLLVKNIKGEGRVLKKEGTYSLSSPEKGGGGGRLLEGGGYLRGELNRGFTVDSSIVGTVTTIIRVAQSCLNMYVLNWFSSISGNV